MGYPSGPAADQLGLTQATGAISPRREAEHLSPAQYLTGLAGVAGWGSFEATQVTPQNAAFEQHLYDWSLTQAGLGHLLLPPGGATTAAGTDAPIQDPPGTHSGPGASAPILNALSVSATSFFG